jgi:hypothetical protein
MGKSKEPILLPNTKKGGGRLITGYCQPVLKDTSLAE